ncbi:MAG TPA: galactose-1-phosphate uridylyltransferase [Patescibacteria group bacterium]|jgi:UDPglucose--hexose-1-phosphate uridylyltransferase|nr:galactose-1-phosphate uridylyltransferase [Patescibacteria group bacterium]
MSELRHDPIQHRWVIIATDRSKRPTDFLADYAEIAGGSFCPFCPGHEDKTPPEIAAIRTDGSSPNQPGWQVRVIPNKFPALMIEGELERKGMGIYDRMRGIGAHEVIVESPDHQLSLADMPLDKFTKVIEVYRDRHDDLLRDQRFKYILIFKNHGATAGASLAHAHTQIIATPVTPRTVAVELDSARAHHHLKERCLFCDVIDQEIDEGRRVVYLDDQYIAFTPYASRFPFEIMLAPRKHRHRLVDIGPDEVEGLARALKDVLSRLKRALKDPPYNFMFHTAPNTETTHKRTNFWTSLSFDFHWHVEILPRLTKVAGFEWGTGFYINPTAPEEAARFLKEIKL